MNKKSLRLLIILTGKTAAGKDTVMGNLLAKFPFFKKIITTTSRSPRNNEQNGADYKFISRQEFENKIKQGELIEYVAYGGNLYGTEKAQIVNNFSNHTIWRIDPSRAGQIRQFLKNISEVKIIVIYLTAADEVILERLRKRGFAEEEIKTRMKQDKLFWNKYKDNYDFIVENVPGQLDKTINKIAQIIDSYLK